MIKTQRELNASNENMKNSVNLSDNKSAKHGAKNQNSEDYGGRLNMIGTANIGKRQEQETLYVDFVEKVKKEGMVRASLSHSQTHPCEIHFSAILDWQWDGELFSISVTGNRGVCSGTMPAFHIYEQESDGGRAR